MSLAQTAISCALVGCAGHVAAALEVEGFHGALAVHPVILPELFGEGLDGVPGLGAVHGVPEGFGEAAGLFPSGLDQDEGGAGIGCGSPELGAGGDGAHGHDELVDEFPGHGPVGVEPLAAPAGLEVLDEGGHVDDHVLVDEAGADLLGVHVGGAGDIVPVVEVVDRAEVVGLGLLGMDGEGMGDVDGGVDVGLGVGGDEASEDGGADSLLVPRGLLHGEEVVPFGPEDPVDGVFDAVRVIGEFIEDFAGAPGQVVDLGDAEQQGLPSLLLGAVLAVEADVEGVLDGLEDL